MTEQSAKSRSTSHILQHTAVVFAGMASIGLTVGAGTYIGHQIGAGELPEVIGSGIPAVIGTGAAIDSNLHRALEPSAPHAKNPAPSRVSQVPRAATGTPIPNPNADRIIAPSADPLPVTSVVPASTSNENASVASSFGPSDVPRTAESDNPHRRVGGRVRLTEHTFVSTDLARGQSNSLTMTVNSNLPAALSRSAPGQTGAQPLPDRASQVRTDVDVHSGDVTVAVDDPVLGAGGFSVREPIR